MPKVIMMKGLPASGKSTAAKDMVLNHPSKMMGRVNRDDLRAMVFCGEWTGKREELIIEMEQACAKILLRANHGVVIDDTNLTDKTQRMWDIFAKTHQAKFEEQYLDVPIQECIARDALRGDKSVGPAVINRLALAGGHINFGDKPIVWVDIDGSIADGTHRESLIAEKPKNWPAYFSLLHLDSPIQAIIDQVNELAKTHTVCIVSGRPDTYQRETVKWLEEIAKIQYDYLFMRAGNDTRDDTVIKLEILNKLPKEKIVIAYDDRPRVCRALESAGLNVFWCRGKDCPDF